MISMSLQEKVAVVTGATGALGRVVTKALLQHGAQVIATFRRQKQQEELRAFVGDHVGELKTVQVNVTDEYSVHSLMQETMKEHGRIDILLNIVGAYTGGAEVSEMKVSDWDFMMNVNLNLRSYAPKPHCHT
jgi:3-oxoacyl-[acyl-carrier protein] reductase